MSADAAPPGEVSAAVPQLSMRLRLVAGETIVLGPGKVELMQWIGECGSIAEAARRMGMSYNRAWLHVKVLNEAFREPLILSLRGGSARGGASLSPAGKRVVALYQRMAGAAEAAAVEAGAGLQELLAVRE